MSRFLLPTIIAAFLIFLTACNSSVETGEAAANTADSKAEFEQTIEQAEAAYKAVDQVGGGWTLTEQMMDESKKAAAGNDYASALQLAKDAYDQSVMAKQQHESQINAGPTRF